MNNNEVIRVLLVEDDDDDARLAKAAILDSPEAQGLPVQITHLRSMHNVMQTLAKADPPFDSVLIDLGMLGSQPLKTLEAIKEFCQNVQTNTSYAESPAATQVRKQFPVLSKDIVLGQESILSQQLLGNIYEERKAREDASRRYGHEFREISLALMRLTERLEAFQRLYAHQVSTSKDEQDDIKELIRDLQESVPTNAMAIALIDARLKSTEESMIALRQEISTVRQEASAPAPPASDGDSKEENLKDKIALLAAQYKWQLITSVVGALITVLIARFAPSGREAADQLKQPAPSFPPTSTPTPAPAPSQSPAPSSPPAK